MTGQVSIPNSGRSFVSLSEGFQRKNPVSIKLKSFYGNDEKTLLSEFRHHAQGIFQDTYRSTLCAHNGKEFDYPYIARRMIINGLAIPECLITPVKNPGK